MGNKPEILTSFIRYNVVAVLATLVDFGVYVLLYQMFNVWYVASAFISAVSGGVVAFFFNRNWAFMGKNGNLSIQAIRYLIVWIGSILLNTSGLFLIVECTGMDKVISKVIISVIVGYGFNFLMNRYYIFKNERNTTI